MAVGTKGRDLHLWLTAIASVAGGAAWLQGACLPGRALLLLSAVAFCCFWVIQWIDIPRARRWSRALGLKHVVVVPVSPRWVSILLALARRRLPCSRRAYEVHISAASAAGTVTTGEHLKTLEEDLITLKDILPGCLLLWETSAPIPSSIRRIIRSLQRQGCAIWERGRWPVPGFPLMPSKLDYRHVRRGALIVPGGKGGP